MHHRCKICGLSFSNVRALCGHLQIHRESHKSAEKRQEKQGIKLGFIDKKKGTYDFRKNPKKYGWVSCNDEEEMGCYSDFCKICKKGFKSSKALHGHMRLHSVRKARVSRRMMEEKLKLPDNLPREKRSVRRYKINTCSIISSWSGLNNDNSGASCSSVGEVELKEIASCLLMLCKGGFYSADNNVSDDFVEIEPKFSCDSVLMVNESGHNVETACKDSCDDDDENNVMEGVSVVDSRTNHEFLGNGYVSFEEIAEFKGLDAGFLKFRQEIEELGTNHDVLGSGYVSFDEITEFEGLESGVLNFRPEIEELGDAVNVQHDTRFEVETADVAPECSGFRGVLDSKGSDVEESKCVFVGGSESTDQVPDKLILGNSGLAVGNNSQLKYICTFCNNSFRSGQSLGGHRVHCPPSKRPCTLETVASVKSNIESFAVVNQEAENGSVELLQSRRDDTKKRRKEHTCLLCSKSFASGQALGGHMRAHFTEKQNGALDTEIPATVEGDMSLHHVHNTLSALAPVA